MEVLEDEQWSGTAPRVGSRSPSRPSNRRDWTHSDARARRSRTTRSPGRVVRDRPSTGRRGPAMLASSSSAVRPRSASTTGPYGRLDPPRLTHSPRSTRKPRSIGEARDLVGEAASCRRPPRRRPAGGPTGRRRLDRAHPTQRRARPAVRRRPGCSLVRPWHQAYAPASRRVPMPATGRSRRSQASDQPANQAEPGTRLARGRGSVTRPAYATWRSTPGGPCPPQRAGSPGGPRPGAS